MELGLLSPRRRKLKVHVIAAMKYLQTLPKKEIVNSTGPGCTGRHLEDKKTFILNIGKVFLMAI